MSVVASASAVAFAGPYNEPGVASNSPSIKAWATGFTNLTRGPQDINNPSESLASFGAGASALGAADAPTSLVSLGDGGSITLSFASGISNGPGADFAVFENGFSVGQNVYAELGFVEVSSNGVNFFRFPSVSLTQSATPVGSFGTIDPTDVFNLAGKHVALSGTPFDLQALAGASPLLDVNNVGFVRVVDVVGRITSAPGNTSWAPSVDSLGNIINDPYATTFGTGGFDLDAIGVINVIPEPTALCLGAFAAGAVLRRRRITSKVPR